jgi:hypothetical protein
LNHDPPTFLSPVTGIIGMHQHAWLIFAKTGLKVFSSCLCLPGSWDCRHFPPSQACFWDMVMLTIFPRLSSAPQSSHFCLPNSWDYSHVPPHTPTIFII